MKTSKQQKLLTSQQFRASYDGGQKLHTPFFTAFLLRTDGHQQRIGITVTRKVGGAVIRNRCKRRIREVLRRQKHLAPNGVGYDLVINAKAGLVEADFKQLECAFDQTFRRIRETLSRQGG